MTAPSTPTSVSRRTMLSKVPEVTVWFWIIKVLCTTVGESFADWINVTLGVGLEVTAVIFTVVLTIVLAWQLTLRRYVPFVYWLAVVVLSVTGTLYTDVVTDDLGVPLAVSTAVFAAVLAVVFGMWWRSQRTLSIHSITTTRRELFYWLAVLVTFALGTAAGDGILELTGWSPGVSVLLPAGLIGAVVLGWRMGANAVLCFWLAYILTRPLGANLGDWLGFDPAEGGLGLGVGVTSVIFLVTILGTVVYVTLSRVDRADPSPVRHARATSAARERSLLLYFAGVAVVAVGVLTWAHAQPRSAAAASEEGPNVAVTLAPGQSAVVNFPADTVAGYRTIVQDTLAKVRNGDQGGAKTRIADLEAAWDQDQATLEAQDSAAWTVIDGRIDAVLTSIRASSPDATAETTALEALMTTLAS